MGMSVERDQVVEDPDHSPTRETAQPFVGLVRRTWRGDALHLAGEAHRGAERARV